MSFAAALYGASGSLRRSCKPGKWESFGTQFTGDIVVENITLNPYGKINGLLIIDLEQPLTHYGIRIQLEAQLTLKFETKLDGRVSFHKKYDNILEGSGEMDPYDVYQLSPVMTDILPPKDECYELPAGNNRFRFSIQATGESLPAPFKTSYGTLVYKLVAYMFAAGQCVQIGEKVMRFAGYHNLSQNVDALKPIQIERHIKKSIFSSKKIVMATLNLESCGYLPKEDVPFTLSITNAKCLPLKLWMALHQRVVYNVDGAKKATLAVLDSAMHEIAEPGTESIWQGNLKVHKAASPSYCIHPMYTVSHVLQFKIRAEDYGMVKADIPIFIGSTREPIELLMISANSLTVLDHRFQGRRGSTSSAHSDCSGLSGLTLPPAYSQLSSRRPSLETLPPPYDCKDENYIFKNEERSGSRLEFYVVPPEDETSGNDSQHDVTPAASPVDDD